MINRGGSPLKHERRPVLSTTRRPSSLLAGLEDRFDNTTLSDAEAWGNAMLYAVDDWQTKRRNGWRHG